MKSPNLEPQPQGNLLIGEGGRGTERERKTKRENEKHKERERGERADNKNHGQCRVAQLPSK